MSRRSRRAARPRLLIVLLLALVPLASAQLPLPTPTAIPTPSPAIALTPSTTLDIDDGPFTFRGPANDPDLVVVEDRDGKAVLTYAVDAEGRARLDVAGENAVADATLVRVEGNPSGEAFRLVLRDPQGGIHTVDVDRKALAAVSSQVPPSKPPVEVTRPPTWPGAPQRAYLLAVADSGGNRLAADQLTGAAFLRKAGNHHAYLQIPLAENEWDRWFLTAKRVGQTATLNATFATVDTTETAMVLDAAFAPSLLSPAEGENITFTITYEKRLSPLVVQRFVEDRGYRFRVDGGAPSVYVTAPPNALEFKFPVSWGGSDSLSGLGYFLIEMRVTGGSTQWTHWITTPLTSATFQGDWGKTYEFRARSYDRVGNPSAEAVAATSVPTQPSGEDDVNDPPTARLLTPRAGSDLAGVVPITWVAEDPDDSLTSVRIEISGDEGETYRLLYAGTDTSTTWDTTSEADGAGYKLRLTVSDGTQSASDTAGGLLVRNVVAPPPPPEPVALPGPSGGASPTPEATGTQPGAAGGEEPVTPAEDRNDTPLPASVLVAALGVAALVLRRKP